MNKPDEKQVMAKIHMSAQQEPYSHEVLAASFDSTDRLPFERCPVATSMTA